MFPRKSLGTRKLGTENCEKRVPALLVDAGGLLMVRRLMRNLPIRMGGYTRR